MHIPEYADIQAAARRLAGVDLQTPVLTSGARDGSILAFVSIRNGPERDRTGGRASRSRP